MDELIDLSGYETPDSAQKGDEKLGVRFYKKSVLNKLKTYGGSILDEWGKPKKDAKGDPMTYEAAGRNVYDQVVYVRITPPDTIDKHNIVDRPASDLDKQRFRKHYQAFLQRSQKAPEGTPLEKFALLEPNQIDELRYLGVHTIEKLAGLKRGEIPDIGGLEQMVQHANDYLSVAKGASPATQLRAELSKQSAEMDALKKQMAELLAGKQPQPPKKRGRPAKVTQEPAVQE